jgi:hypothetical protein
VIAARSSPAIVAIIAACAAASIEVDSPLG